MRDLSPKARRAGRQRKDPVAFGPGDERWRDDLVQVLDVRTTGAETGEDVIGDSAGKRIETQVDGVRWRGQLAGSHDVAQRELARAGAVHEALELPARDAHHAHLAREKTRDPLRLGT